MCGVRLSHKFISHSKGDSAFALQLVAGLESAGVTCWIAPRNIPPGSDWAEAIIDGIESADGFILIVSKTVNDSPHIRRELEQAVSLGIPVYPVITEEFEHAKWLRYFNSAHQWIHAVDASVEQVISNLTDATTADSSGEDEAGESNIVATENMETSEKVDAEGAQRLRRIRGTARSFAKQFSIRRKQVVTSFIISYLAGFSIWLFHFMILAHEQGNAQLSIGENMLGISGVYPWMVLVSIPYGYIGALLAFMQKRRDRAVVVFAVFFFYISLFLIGAFFLGVPISSVFAFQHWWSVFPIAFPVCVLFGSVIGIIAILSGRWITRNVYEKKSFQMYRANKIESRAERMQGVFRRI